MNFILHNRAQNISNHAIFYQKYRKNTKRPDKIHRQVEKGRLAVYIHRIVLKFYEAVLSYNSA